VDLMMEQFSSSADDGGRYFCGFFVLSRSALKTRAGGMRC